MMVTINIDGKEIADKQSLSYDDVEEIKEGIKVNGEYLLVHDTIPTPLHVKCTNVKITKKGVKYTLTAVPPSSALS